jgi:hypothetical protein
MSFARGKYALGICDRCGCAYKLIELRKEVQDGRRMSMKVCSSCFDPDHPQWRTKQNVIDYESLFEPRPDKRESFRSVFGWTPLPLGVECFAELGTVNAVVPTGGIELPPPPPIDEEIEPGFDDAVDALHQLLNETMPAPNYW